MLMLKPSVGITVNVGRPILLSYNSITSQADNTDGYSPKRLHQCLWLSYIIFMKEDGHSPYNINIQGDSIKIKPNCLCHIYLILDHIITKL